MKLKTPTELVDYIELNFSKPQPELFKLVNKPLNSKNITGQGQLVVKLMADELYLHLSNQAWCHENAKDLGVLWDLLEQHQCLAGDFYSKFKSEMIKPLGEGGGATTTTTTSGGCPNW
ncbi:hypothetical protein [Citrobacter sp. RHBSTW-00671]|uniref:hypothetical protein n=1 Tax=Citrobacter sp. RHBSTW-00671 TaxID=2742660 RepID=UPI00185C4C7B|nr:hypothetical protein [Citrobacter sp. RHBSTW-00671]MBA7967875.1 hypothetical protein [Citrobacter sp. RHBSTW-00671]HCJ6374179.1 hypothetical protein [Citrobacter freundii]